MKADCPNCKHLNRESQNDMHKGYCDSPNQMGRVIYDFSARNCDGFGFLAKVRSHPYSKIDPDQFNAEMYGTFAMNDKGRVTHG